MSTTLNTAAAPADSLRNDYPKDRETFWYMSHRWLYDVDHALRLLKAAPREPVEVEEFGVRAAVRESELNKNHVPKVDPSRPGIIAHVRFRTAEGELLKGHVLIDGHHRAYRCLHEDRPFFAHVLTEWESLEVLLRCPDDTRPSPEESAELYELHQRQLAEGYPASVTPPLPSPAPS
jgi:hypothetical protein